MTLTLEEQIESALQVAQEGSVGKMESLLTSINPQFQPDGRKTSFLRGIQIWGYKRAVEKMLDEMAQFAYEGIAIEDFLIETFIEITEKYIKLKYGVDFNDKKIPESFKPTPKQIDLGLRQDQKKRKSGIDSALTYAADIAIKLDRIVNISYDNGLYRALQKAEEYAIQNDHRVQQELWDAERLAQRLNRDIEAEKNKIKTIYQFFSA